MTIVSLEIKEALWILTSSGNPGKQLSDTA